jgi:hypothetical protein
VDVPEIVATPGPSPVELQEALPQQLPPAVPEQAPAPAEPSTAEPAGEIPWLYIGLAAALALLGFFAFRRLQSRPTADEASGYDQNVAEEAPAPVAAPMPPPVPPAPAPAPVAAAPAGDIVGIQIRPWLELEFRPDRAAATLTEANVQYQLIVRNVGNRAARNVRIEARMFNAGNEQEQEIGAFFGEPVRERTPPAIENIPPRGEVQLRSSVIMPKESVREITVEGRRLFIPMVAFNVVYEWGENRFGQTSTSYVVGREAQTPSEKMGAFRLDLGPRLYRSVGQRQTRLARIV